MAKKRYTPPETVLRRVIEGLEHEDEAKHRAAVLTLLADGPLNCAETLRQERVHPTTVAFEEGVVRAADLVRAELLALLRNVVRHRDSSYGQGITIDGPTRLFAHAVGDSVRIVPEGTMRDLVILQLVLLLHTVGLRNVRKCEAADCERLYVKTYRRQYCSARCQKRTHMRAWRHDEQERQAQQRQARARRRREGVSV